MRDYGKVHSTFWSSATIAKLSDDGRMLALYLMTSPHSTIAGVFRLPDGYVCEDLRWSSERVSEGFRELFANGFANRCETTKWVWICKHLDWNPPENPNQRKSAAKVASAVPAECGWKLDFMRVCGPSLGFDEAKKANPSATVPKPLLNQEQEQEQEQDIGTRATRLPKDWACPADWLQWAKSERADLDPRRTADSFRDYWTAKPGKDGRKLDWQATWRNWVRAQRQSPMGGKPGPASASDPFAGCQ